MFIDAPVPVAAPAPRPRRAVLLTGWQACRSLARWTAWLLIAACSLSLVGWLTVYWGILPHLDRWKPAIEERAGRALGVTVRIGRITVESGGWMPAFDLRDIALQDAAGRTALALPQVRAALSPRSLLWLELRFDQLLIEGAQLDVRRDSSGRISVGGLPLGGAGAADDASANWFFRQSEFVIRGGSVRWTDEQRGAPTLTLGDVQLVVRNGLRSHDLRLDATPPDGWGERFSVLGRFVQPLLARSGDWKRWSGNAYASLPRADLRELQRHVDLPFELHEGSGALRAWLEVRDGEPRSGTVDLALRAVRLRLAKTVEPLALAEIEGRLEGRRTDGGFSLAGRRFGFVAVDAGAGAALLRWPRSDLALTWRQQDGGDFHAEQLDLSLIAQLAAGFPLPSRLRRILAEAAPQGQVGNLAVRWDGPLDAPTHYRVEGAVKGLALRAGPSAEPAAPCGEPGRPGISNADLTFTASDVGGEASLAIAGGMLDFPGVFDEPQIPVGRLAAQLAWRIDPAVKPSSARRVSLQVRDARFANADLQGSLDAVWSGAADDGPGQLDLTGRLGTSVANRVARYLPLRIGRVARDYVAHAVRGGTVRGAEFRLRGKLRDFPFDTLRDPKEGEFRVAARVEDVDFAYVPGPVAAEGGRPAESPWPPFAKVRGQLIVDRGSLEIRDAEATVHGVALHRVKGRVPRLDDHWPVLEIDGRANGSAADMLVFVEASPVSRLLNGWLTPVVASGNAELALALAVPFNDGNATTLHGSLTLAGNDVRLRPDMPLLAQARGRIDFDERGVRVDSATARLLGGDARVSGGSVAGGGLRFDVDGTFSADGLRRDSGVGALSRLAASLTGQSAYRFALGVTNGNTEFDLRSDLTGLGSSLPEPLAKRADTALPLHVQTALLPGAGAGAAATRDTLRVDVGSVLEARYLRDLSGPQPRVLNGGIGVMEPAPTPANGVAASITLPLLDADAWSAVIGNLAATGNDAAAAAAAVTAAGVGADPSGGYAPASVGLRVQELLTQSRRLRRVVAGASEDNGTWRVNIDAEQLAGYAEFRAARRGPGRVYARLARLSLPNSDAEQVDSLLDPGTASIPALDIVVDDLELRGKKLGRVEIEAGHGPAVRDGSREGARESRREWQLSRLAITVPEARLLATGRWAEPEPAAIGVAGPPKGAPPRRVSIDFKLDISDSGALLERLAVDRTVRGGAGQMSGQLSWLGSPLALDYPSLGGKFELAIRDGQFLKAEPGAARLLSVLSMQSLPRRLVLDFRDVFRAGFAFDNVDGEVTIADGVARSNNLRMRGVQAAVLMEGHADIARETQDLRVVVVPEINAGTASLAYAVINPAIGLATFLAQALLRKPLIEAGTREFHITGDWSDPKIARVDRSLPGPKESGR